MATRCRVLSRPAFNLLKSSFSQSSISGTSSPSSSLFHISKRSSPLSLSRSRQFSQLGSLQSMLPLHTAVSTARLTSGLGMDSMGSRSMTLGMAISSMDDDN